MQSGFIRIYLDGVLVLYNYKVSHLYLLYLSDQIYLPPPPLTVRYLNICKLCELWSSEGLHLRENPQVLMSKHLSYFCL